MKDTEIKGHLDDAIRSAVAYDRTELSDKRATALNYYFGDMPDVVAKEGRSSVVSRDVAVVIGWMLPGIIRTFTQSGRIVDFEPSTPEDEETSDQASDYLNHKFMKDNDGYRVMYTAIHDALLHGNGIIKCYWDSTPEYETSIHTGLTEDQLTLLIAGDDVEVTAKDEYTESISDPTTGQSMDLMLYDVKIRRKLKEGDLKVEAIEPENFLMDKENFTTIPESRFTAQRQTVMKSDLVEMGFDKKIVDSLPTDGTYNFEEEALVRQEDRINISDNSEESTQLLELYECYIKLDVDDDGVAETVRAFYAGNHGAGELLEWEVWEDEYPFVDVPCEPVPHRFDALSIADSTMDLQKIKTSLQRQMLDNVYATNNPQPQLEEGSVLNTESIVAPKFGQPIIRRRGTQPVEWTDTPFVADKALAAIQSVDQEIERRTGISRNTMALDPDALQNQTATAVNAQKDASYSKVELVARNMAELGFRNLFRLALRLIVKHQDRAEMIRLRGKWVPMDPRHWNADMDCTVNTGLGTGSRERDIMALNQTLSLQMNFMERYLGQGMNDKVVEMIPMITRTAVKIAESSGLKNGDDYYPDASPEAMQQVMAKFQEKEGQPSPEEQKIQGEMQMEQQRMQMEMQQKQQEFQGKMELEKMKIQQQAMREEAQMNADIQVHQHEAELKFQYQDKELAAKSQKELRDHEVSVAELGLKDREVAVKEFEAGLKKQQALVDSQFKIDQHEDQIDMQEKQVEVTREGQRQAAKSERGGSQNKDGK